MGVQFKSSSISMLSPLLLLLVPLISSHTTYQVAVSHPHYSYSYKTLQPRPVSKPVIRTNPGSLTAKYNLAKSAPKSRVNTNSGSLSTKYKQAILNTQSAVRTAGLSGSDDIVKQTRAQAESLKDDLKSLGRNPRAAQIVNKVFSDRNNVCIKSMDDAIEAIETSTKLFENAGSEIKQLINTLGVFERKIDTPAAVRETAKIIRLLDILIPKLTPDTFSKCNPSSTNVFGSLQSLAGLVDELSSKDDIYFSTQKRQSLKSSAKIVIKVTDFLSKLTNKFSRFDRFCTSDKSYNIEVITALSEMMADLAGLYRALDGHDAAFEISKQGDFTQKVVANLKQLGDLELISLDCNKAGSFQGIANAVEDLAGLIEEVGLDNLCNQLNLDCTL